MCHYEPSRKAWRDNPVKNRRFFTNAASVVTTRFINNLRLPEMIADKSVTTPTVLMNCYAIHWIATPLQATARNDTVFIVNKLQKYKRRRAADSIK